jgi:hypothetical protein
MEREGDSEKEAMQAQMQQQASEIAEKEGELQRRRQAQLQMEARLDAGRRVLVSCAQRDAELHQLRCSGDSLREVERHRCTGTQVE